MSANNWRVCPRCLRRLSAAHERMKAKVTGLYGKVSRAEYEAAREALPPPPDESKMRATLREYYQLGVRTSGEFFLNYSASCDECGFAFRFEDVRATGALEGER